MEIAGEEISSRELLKKILRDRPFYDQSGGGVTFSGGEPLCQLEFLREINDLCRSAGIHTALDTSGYYNNREEFIEICSRFNLVLYDLKLLDKRKHIKYTGVGNDIILKNLQELAMQHENVRIRYPLVQGVNDADEDIIALSGFLADLKQIQNIDILPYHSMAKEKWKKVGLDYKLKNIKKLTKDRVKLIVMKLEKSGLNIQIGG